MYLYFWAIAGNIASILTLVAALSGIIWLIATVVYVIASTDKQDDCAKEAVRVTKSLIKKSLIVFAISAFLRVLIPSQEALAAMYILPKLANSDLAAEIAEDAPEVYRMGVDALKSHLTKGEDE